MAKQVSILTTKTDILEDGNNVGIFTYFIGSLSYLRAFISDKVQTISNIIFKENELGFSNKDYDDVDYFIDNEGNLIILSDSNKTFSLNNDGELIMEETI